MPKRRKSIANALELRWHQRGGWHAVIIFIVGNQNAYLWRKRVVMEGNMSKRGGVMRISAVFCSFRLVNTRKIRLFTDLPCHKWLQTICIKWQMGTAISLTSKDCSYFCGRRGAHIFAKLTIQEHLGEILSSLTEPAFHIYNSGSETHVLLPYYLLVLLHSICCIISKLILLDQ